MTTALPVSGATDEEAGSAIRAAFPRAADVSVATLTSTATRFSFEPRASRPPGSRAPTIYLILSGQVALSQASADGRVSVLGLYGPGTLVGLTTFTGGPDLLGIEALTVTSGVAWPTDHLREVAEQDCGMLQDVLDQFVHRVRLTLGLLEQQTFATARARLAAFMAHHEELVFSPRIPAIGRVQLSAMVGVSREMTSRILRGWERAGIVGRIGRSGLILLDRRRLEAEAEAAPDRASIDEARSLIS